MREQSIQEQVEIKIKSEEKGTIFVKNDFYELGSDEAIKKAILRLTEKGIVHRLINGFYTIPKYSEIIQEYSYPTPDQLAKKIAEKYTWKISPFGETALNIFGFSTQVSARYEYISDGPYRQYEYMGRTIQFKHTNNRSISAFSKELALVIQIINALGEDKITSDHIFKLAAYCRKNVPENLKQDAKQVPAWIYNVLKKINEVSIDA